MTAGPSWSDIAGWYDDLLVAGSGPHDTAVRSLLGLVPDLAGADVLDLACGTGLASRALVAAGAARVVGIDSSDAMLDRARAHGGPIAYELDDAQVLATVGDGSFDGVTCQLALMDIPDLDATLAAVRRVLRPDGWLVFVIGHPCTLVPPDGRGYFEARFWRSPNPEGVRRAGNHHRPLATYLNALVAHGFVLEAVDEPRPTELHLAQRPDFATTPMLLAARCRRSG